MITILALLIGFIPTNYSEFSACTPLVLLEATSEYSAPGKETIGIKQPNVIKSTCAEEWQNAKNLAYHKGTTYQVYCFVTDTRRVSMMKEYYTPNRLWVVFNKKFQMVGC